MYCALQEKIVSQTVLTIMPMQSDLAHTVKMLESDVSPNKNSSMMNCSMYVVQVLSVLRTASGFVVVSRLEKEELKSVLEGHGGQCVMMVGVEMMLLLLAGS